LGVSSKPFQDEMLSFSKEKRFFGKNMLHTPVIRVMALRITCLCILIWVVISKGFTQNVVPNPGFETFTICPPNFNIDMTLECEPWFVPTGGTADYFNACHSGGIVGVPVNMFGTQPAHSGDAYVGGFYYYSSISGYREYVEVQLSEPLVAGTSYVVNLYYSVADLTCPVDQIGIHISTTSLTSASDQPLAVTPQIAYSGGVFSGNDWHLLTGCYVALGDEQFLTIGNFAQDGETTVGTGCPLFSGSTASYIYVDDVLVEVGPPGNEIPFMLADDVTVCDSYEIVAPISNVTYIWEDGSHEQTLTVTESGVYHLTVTNGCDIGTDSIDVEVLYTPDPIDLGEPLVILCSGDVIDYDFDPVLGDYTWQDNSTSASYSIDGPGTYSVTLSTPCGDVEDQIIVIGMDIPDPIDLGMDVTLCPLVEMLLSLDPALGDIVWHDGSTNPDFTITEPGTYAVTVSNICGEVSDEIVVDYYPEPFVIFNVDTIALCEGETTTLSLDPAIGEYFWNDGTAGPEYLVTQPGIYSVTVVNPCGSDNTSIVVDYDFEPIINLADITICPEQLPYHIDLTGWADVELFVWDDGTTDPTFTITSAGNYGVTVSNDCFEVWDFIEVTVEDAEPLVMLPEDTVLCPGEFIILDVGNIPGTYQWQDNNTSSVYEVTQNGIYSVTVTNACGTGSDTVVVNYGDLLPALDLGPDLSLCPGEQVVIDPGIAGVDFLWHDGSMLDTLVVDAGGAVILTISNGCMSVSDSVQITFNAQAPDAGLPAQLSLCTGETVTIETTVDGAIYSWNTGSTASFIVVTEPGQYILTVTNSCGMDIDTTDVIDFGANPIVDLGPDQSICPGETIVFNPGIPGAYQWHDGTSDPVFETNIAGEITVSITNACGTASDTVIIIMLDPIPVLDIGADTSICPGNSVLIAPGIPNVDYLWSDGSTGSSLVSGIAGDIVLAISNACGVSMDTMTISLLPDVPSLDLGVDFTLCPGEVVILDPELNGVSYLWQDGSTASTFTVDQTSQIILAVSNSCGIAIDTVNVTEDSTGPVLELGPDISVCEGETVLLDPGINGVSYLWQDGSTNSTLLVTSSSMIVLQISNACGMSTDSINVVISGLAPELELGPDIVVCEGETVLLDPGLNDVAYLWQDGSTNSSLLVTASSLVVLEVGNACGTDRDTIDVEISGIAPQVDLGPDILLCDGETMILIVDGTGSIIEWQDGSSGPEQLIETSGLYTVSLTNNCGVASDSVNVVVDLTPEPFDLGMDQLICAGDVISLHAPVTSNNLLWSTGSTASVIEVSDAGEYALVISNDCGESSDAIAISINTEMLTNITDQMFAFCKGDELILDVHQLVEAMYLWNTGSTNSQITVNDVGEYSVTITSACDELIENIIIEPGDCVNPEIFIPNAFSPNGDNINDVFRIELDDRDVVAFQILIYDRWGEVVYNSPERLKGDVTLIK
jgi:hypothetical protein